MCTNIFACGRRFRIIAVVDDCNRECVRLIAGTLISSIRVARELDVTVLTILVQSSHQARCKKVQTHRQTHISPVSVFAIVTILLKARSWQRVKGDAEWGRVPSHFLSGGRGARHRDDLGHFAEVLGWIDYVATRASWTLKVADDGVGMPADGDKAKLGLGTSIVNALAK